MGQNTSNPTLQNVCYQLIVKIALMSINIYCQYKIPTCSVTSNKKHAQYSSRTVLKTGSDIKLVGVDVLPFES